MDARTVNIMSGYSKYLQQRKEKPEGFWSKFVRRTSLRAGQLLRQPVESTIYYTLSALPVPMWGEEDAAQVTDFVSKRIGGKGFAPPHLPSEREVNLMKTLAIKEFKRFLEQDPGARAQFMQHYHDQHGEIPVKMHAFLARPAVKPSVALYREAIGRRFSGLVNRMAARKPVQPGARPRFAFEHR